MASLPTGALTQFHLFSNLSAKIRLVIWKSVEKERRVVILEQTQGPNDNHQGVNIPRSFIPRCSGDVPTLLHTNREAREVALKTYSLLFGTLTLIRSILISIEMFFTSRTAFRNGWRSDQVLQATSKWFVTSHGTTTSSLLPTAGICSFGPAHSTTSRRSEANQLLLREIKLTISDASMIE